MSIADKRETPRRLKVDLADLALAMTDGSFELHHYLDLATGEVVTVSDETRRDLERLYEEVDGEDDAAVAAAIARLDRPAWMIDALREAHAVEAGFGTRFVAVPRIESREAYGVMEDFIETVGEERLQSQLWRAIDGRGAFRRFKDVLADHPAEEERWFRFEQERERQWAVDWLRAEGIEPVVAERGSEG